MKLWPKSIMYSWVCLFQQSISTTNITLWFIIKIILLICTRPCTNTYLLFDIYNGLQIWSLGTDEFWLHTCVQVFDGWVMKGEKFPNTQDHPLPMFERYVDYCDSGSGRRSVRSNQNVAMLFFRVHNAGSSFTITVRKHINPFRESFYTAFIEPIKELNIFFFNAALVFALQLVM